MPCPHAATVHSPNQDYVAICTRDIKLHRHAQVHCSIVALLFHEEQPTMSIAPPRTLSAGSCIAGSRRSITKSGVLYMKRQQQLHRKLCAVYTCTRAQCGMETARKLFVVTKTCRYCVCHGTPSQSIAGEQRFAQLITCTS